MQRLPQRLQRFQNLGNSYAVENIWLPIGRVGSILTAGYAGHQFTPAIGTLFKAYTDFNLNAFEKYFNRAF